MRHFRMCQLKMELFRKKMPHGLDFANAKSGKRKSKKETAVVSSNPCDIPESWCWCRLRDVCDAQLGKTLDKSKNKGD